LQAEQTSQHQTPLHQAVLQWQFCLSVLLEQTAVSSQFKLLQSKLHVQLFLQHQAAAQRRGANDEYGKLIQQVIGECFVA